MADNELATVTQIWPRAAVDPDAPFCQYRNAGLINARFGIDGDTPLFWGYHHADERWNGWAAPGFRAEVAGLIAEWVNGSDAGNAWWDGEVLCFCGVDDDHVDRIEPDYLGLYRFDGWAWLEVTPDA